MSLVQAFINQNFILVCGEQRAILSDGKVDENFVKVKKINSNIIIGMTGTIEGNASLFSEFINGDFSLKENICFEKYDYNQALQIVTNNFNSNLNYIKTHHVHSLICGWNNNIMTGRAFFVKENGKIKIHDLTPDYPGHVKFINCGDERHYKNAEKIFSLTPPNNIIQCKNLFLNIIDEGVKFDKGINKNCTFEKIRRVDFIKNVNL